MDVKDSVRLTALMHMTINSINAAVNSINARDNVYDAVVMTEPATE